MYRKRRIVELWIPVDCLLYREIIQFACENDAPDRVKRARTPIDWGLRMLATSGGSPESFGIVH